MGQRQKWPGCICIPNNMTHEAVVLQNFLPLTINVEHLTKPVNMKWISDRPELGTTC
jgi:hypothetical protein